MAKLYTLTIRNRTAAAVFTIALLGLGAVLLTVGVALLAGLAIAGGVLGTGYALVQRFRGGSREQTFGRSAAVPTSELDPALEIRPIRPAIISSIENDTH